MFTMLGRPISAILRAVSLTALVLLIAGCGGGSGSPIAQAINDSATCDPNDPATAAECGTVLVSVTDAEGDFVSYSVDILSLTLQRQDGSTVETLPAATRVDFAQLVDLSEVLSAVTTAPGDIAGGSIRLDYTNAEVYVEAGGDIVPATVVDDTGQPLGVTDLEIRLADDDRLIVTRGRVALLSVDFDLAASHVVDTTMSPLLVTAQPYIVAEVEPVDEKETRLRGALLGVDLDAATYTVAVRPWHRRDGEHGQVVVNTTGETSFEIGDTMHTGQEGLEALAELPTRTVVVAFGTLNVAEREFTAEIVHAGLSVGGEDIDAVFGNVVARSGDQLTVKGAFAVRRDRVARFHRTIIVNVGPETRVFKISNDALLNDDAISVGQRIAAFGTIVSPDAEPADAADPEVAPIIVPILDATDGRVRLLVTHLHGRVTSVMPGQLNMALRGIDRLGIDHFDFSGTGMTSDVDANPADYEVATSTLPLANVETDRSVKVMGFVTPFGMAPPDFEGRTVVDHRSIPSVLGMSWDEDGTLAPFMSMGSDGLVLNLDNGEIGERHHIKIGREEPISLLELPGSPLIAPTDSRRALYGIAEPGHVELFRNFTDFVDELTLRLNSFSGARSLSAYGRYDEVTNTLTAYKIAVYLVPPEE